MIKSLLALLIFPLSIFAADNLPQNVPPQSAPSEYETFIAALLQSPSARAWIGQALAEQRAQEAAGRLPDPELELGYSRLRMPMENRPIYEVMLTQPLPRWGERDAGRALARAHSNVERAMTHERLCILAEELAEQLAMREGFMARVRVGEAELTRINALAQAMNTRVAQGGASALDQLALDARRELLSLKLSDWQRQLIDIESSTRALLDLTPAQQIPSFAAPQLADIQQQHSPQLQIALAQKEQAEAALREAEAQGKPMTAIGVRGMYEDTMDGSERAIGASVSISLPIARGAIHAQTDAARQRVLAAERLIAAEKLMIAHRLGVAQRALEQAQRATLLAEKLRARAQAEQSALITASASGNVSVATILDIMDRISALDMEVIDALVSANQARAGLWTSVVIPLVPQAKNKSDNKGP